MEVRTGTVSACFQAPFPNPLLVANSIAVLFSPSTGTPASNDACEQGEMKAFAGTGGTDQRIVFGWHGLLESSPKDALSILFDDTKEGAADFGGSFINANGFRGEEHMSTSGIGMPPQTYAISGTMFGDEVSGFSEREGTGRLGLEWVPSTNPQPPAILSLCYLSSRLLIPNICHCLLAFFRTRS
jgi:hypothetical protein